MTTETVGATTPEATAAPIVPSAAPEKPRVQADELPPAALAARIEQAKESARKTLLAELGISDPSEAKTAIAEAAARKEAAKTTDQRLAELSLQVANQTAALAVAVDHAAKAITPDQRAAVDAIAGTDQALWLRTYGALASTWGAPPMAAPAPVAAPLPIISTTVGAPAPAPVTQTSPADPYATRAAIEQVNPFAAAAFGLSREGAFTPKT